MVGSPRRDAESPAPARREQIIKAARAVIEEHGPDALTGQIAERAGLARPNVYRHFASKDELDLEVARDAYEQLRAEILARMAQCSFPLDVVRAPIEAQVIWASKHPNLYRFLVSRGYQRSGQRRKSERRDFAAELAEAAAQHLPRFADDPEAAAALIVGLGGLVDASVRAWLSRRTETRKGLIDRLTLHAWLIVDHHLHGLGVHVDPELPLPGTRADAELIP